MEVVTGVLSNKIKKTQTYSHGCKLQLDSFDKDTEHTVCILALIIHIAQSNNLSVLEVGYSLLFFFILTGAVITVHLFI